MFYMNNSIKFVPLNRDEIKALIKGLIKPPYGGDEYSEFCGNQHNEDWKWKDNIFDNMNIEELWEFYLSRKEN